MNYSILTADPRRLGTGNPPQDMNNANDVLFGMGGWLNVWNEAFSGGADPTGSTDSTNSINGALEAAPPGSTVMIPPYYLSAGTLLPAVYATSAPLQVPPQVTLCSGGLHSSHIDVSAACIKPSASFSGPSVILMVDQATGGYANVSNQQGLFYLTLDGSNLTGSTIDGVQSQGYVHGVILQDVQIRDMPNHGIAIIGNSSGQAYSWRGTRVSANTCNGHGFSVSMTDCTWIDLEAIGCGQNGFNLAGSPANSHFIGCRAEYSGSLNISGEGNGFSLNGAWAASTGSGGCMFTGCSTDGNYGAGFMVSATGTVPVIINGLMCRRDGYGDSGAYQSGLCLSGAGIPVTVDGLTVFPGIALTGLSNSPANGVYCHGSTYFSLGSGWVHAATTPISTGSNTICRINPNIGLATGSTSSPVYVYDNPWGTDSGSTFTASLSGNDQTGVTVSAASGVTNANNPLVLLEAGNSASDILLKGAYQGSAHSLLELLTSGSYSVGSGAAAPDTALSRLSAGVWEVGQGFTSTGLPGATATFRIVGAIASGTSPASGTFNTGDVVFVLTGSLLICTAGGSPGTWAVIS